MRAALCLRVSSGKQRDACTVETQREAGMRLITSRGWDLVGEYTDNGVSAKAGNLSRRPAMRKLLDDAEARLFDVVVVYDASRLTRAEDQRERGLIMGTLQIARLQVAYSSTGQVIDAASEAGDFQTTLDALFAARDNRLRRQRTRDGRVRAIRAGRNPGKMPYGYRFDGGTCKAPGAAVVREIYERCAAGESCAQIAGLLNRRGLPTVTKRKGWSASTITDILRPRRQNGDPYVTGQWIGQAGEGAISVPVIVSVELATRARAALAARASSPPPSTRHVQFLDSCAARCGVCGAMIRVAASHGRLRADGTRTRFAYYACERRKASVATGGEPCTLPLRRIEQLDAAVWRAVVAWAESGLVVDAAARASGTERAQAQQDLEAARRQLAADNARLEALAEALGAGALTADSYRAQMGRVKARRDLLAQQVATWEGAVAAPEEPGARARAEIRRAIAEASLSASPAQKRALVRRLFPSWVFDAKGASAVRSGGGLGETKPLPARIAVAC